jgi:hypothetical protein
MTQERPYNIQSVEEAKTIAHSWLETIGVHALRVLRSAAVARLGHCGDDPSRRERYRQKKARMRGRASGVHARDRDVFWSMRSV